MNGRSFFRCVQIACWRILGSGVLMATELVNLSGALARAVERGAGSVVAVQGRPRLGTSGIVWRRNLVLTSNEGVRVEEGIRLLLPDGKAVDAKLRGRDRGTDLA